jgi:hypothetical protein
MRRKPTLAALASLVCQAAMAASAVHVSVDGDDTKPGTADEPVATVRKALELVRGNKEPSEIVIHEGVYPGNVAVGSKDDWEGPPPPPLLIRAADGPDGEFEKVVFDGARKVKPGESQACAAVGVYRVPGKYSYFNRPHVWEADTRIRYTLVADMAAVERFPASFWYDKSEVFFHTSDGKPPEAHEMAMTRDRNGITLWRPNTTVRGIECRSFLAWRWSCGVELRGPHAAAEDCRAWNCVRGFQIMLQQPGTRIVRCRADDCAGGVYSQGLRATIEDCRLYKIRDRFMVPAYPQDDTGIQFYYPASEGEVRRSLCVGFCNGIFVKCPTSRFIVEHNTCAGGISYGMGCTSWHPQSVFRYNVVCGFAVPILGHSALNPTNIVDDNCLWNSAAPDTLKRYIEGPRNAGTGRNSIAADPRFAAPVVRDYRLLPDSPCARMGPSAETCGALGVVGRDFQDVQPPTVRLSVAEPARPMADAGRLYVEQDPWMGGAPSAVCQLPVEEPVAEWITPTPKVKLRIESNDLISGPALMRIRVGTGPEGEPEPYRPEVEVVLPSGILTGAVGVRVSDSSGNWSEVTPLVLRLASDGPQLVGEPAVHVNKHGVVIVFETEVPCKVTVEFGDDPRYGETFEQPNGGQRSWIDGKASLSADWSKTRVSHCAALLVPLVDSGKTCHYRLVLEDDLGNRTVTGDRTFAVTGEPKSYFVSPSGEDAEGGGSREHPWRTIQFAVERALPGDRIALLPGLYAGETVLTHGGLENAPITIEAETPGTAILDGRHHVSTCLRLDAAPHVVIRALELRWFGQPGTFYSTDKAGISIHDSAHVSVLGCKIWNNFWMGWPIGSGIAAWSSPGLVADHNVIYQMEQGVRLYQSPGARITYNTILKNMYGAVKFLHSAEQSVCRNNSFCYSGNDQYLVVYQDEKELESFDSDYNNLGTRLRSPDPGEEIVPEDPFFRSHGSKAVISLNGRRYNGLKAWQKATGKDRRSIFADPKYADPENWDFRLRPGSPNLGAGEDGTTIGALGVKLQ